MELIGHIILALVGIGIFILPVIAICRKQFDIGMQHVSMFIISVGCLILAFIPVSKFSIGTQGLSAELERQQKRTDIMGAVLESTGSSEQRLLLGTILSKNTRPGEWVDVREEDTKSKTTKPSNGGGGGGAMGKPNSPSGIISAGSSSAVDVPENPPPPMPPPDMGRTDVLIKTLTDKGLIDSRVQYDEWQVMVK
jgi:hypothetical protein